MAEKDKFNPNDYWEKRLAAKKGLVGVGYTRLGSYFNNWAYKVRRHVFKKQVAAAKLPVANANVLDIGSGSGFYIRLWKEAGAQQITGVDLTQVAVDDLKRDHPFAQFYQCDIGDADFNKNGNLGKYDMISCMDVLFHIVDDQRFEQAMKNIASLLKEGGYFIYSDNFLHGKELRYMHQACRTKDYLYKVFEQNGLEIKVRKPFMYMTNTPIDSRNAFLRFNWFCIEQFVSRIKVLGWLAGAVLYPFELMLVDGRKEGPTTEFVISRKK